MKAMILAAGLGTRLRPWTLTHPKALVPVDGIPMLERVIVKLKEEGVRDIVINVHHFADQMKAFLADRDFGINIYVSDESGRLLETGGGIAYAYEILRELDGECTLIYNVDILSNVNIQDFISRHNDARSDITLLISGRESSRKLIFDKCDNLRGWHNLVSGEYRPQEIGVRIKSDVSEEFYRAAFSGIYIMGNTALQRLYRRWKDSDEAAFPIMDFLLDFSNGLSIKGYDPGNLSLLDIGKPASLERAHDFIFNK